MDRQLVKALVRVKVFRLQAGFFRCLDVIPIRGSRWLLNAMKRRQMVDSLKHAPCCPANHWHRQRLVFQRCNCGAARFAAQQPAQPEGE